MFFTSSEALAAGGSPIGSSSTLVKLPALRTILKLRNQSAKLLPLFFNFSFSRNALKLMVGAAIDLLEICPRGNNKYSYYYIFVFMINVYIHAIIVLTRKH